MDAKATRVLVGIAQGVDVSQVVMQHDFDTDSIVITKDDKSVKVPRSMVSSRTYEDACRDSMRMLGCSEDTVNQMYKATDRYRLGFTDPLQLRASTVDNDINYRYGAQNAYGFKRKKFPKSEQELDDIMMRRVNARLRLQQEKIIRHWKHVAIVAGIVVFAPLVIAAVLRMWGFCLAWIAS